MKKFWSKVIQAVRGDGKHCVEEVLKRGGVVVIPTDTTYGIVGSAMNERAVHEIYRLRKRDAGKPFIILIADKGELKKFGVSLTDAQEQIVKRVWPASVEPTASGPSSANAAAGKAGAVSVVLRCTDDRFAYLHRGTRTLAFRVPAREGLRELLREVGPLVAPSANPQGYQTAKTVAEARAYFGHHVAHYQDGGALTGKPSRLIDITEGVEKLLRV